MQTVRHCKCLLILASLVFAASDLTAQEAFGQVFDEKAGKKHDADVERAVKEAHAKSRDKAVREVEKAEAERENFFQRYGVMFDRPCSTLHCLRLVSV